MTTILLMMACWGCWHPHHHRHHRAAPPAHHARPPTSPASPSPESGEVDARTYEELAALPLTPEEQEIAREVQGPSEVLPDQTEEEYEAEP